MGPLQERLAPHFSTVAIDWPGFGTEARPAVKWTPQAYAAFLRHVLIILFAGPVAMIAAGHAASYVLAVAAASPGTAGALCLIAPTWRGPLPTMMGRNSRLADAAVRLGDLPLIGPLLYRLNVNVAVVRMMARGHVYSDANWLAGERLREKMAVVNAAGARHASLRFVTGKLDPMNDRATFIHHAERVKVPILVVLGAETPRRSKAEMDALASLPNVRAVELPRGRLAIHEEFPEEVAEEVLSFLGK
jgi:pimeloyl-ACP methyl ester carboxylesterase